MLSKRIPLGRRRIQISTLSRIVVTVLGVLLLVVTVPAIQAATIELKGHNNIVLEARLPKRGGDEFEVRVPPSAGRLEYSTAREIGYPKPYSYRIMVSLDDSLPDGVKLVLCPEKELDDPGGCGVWKDKVELTNEMPFSLLISDIGVDIPTNKACKVGFWYDLEITDVGKLVGGRHRNIGIVFTITEES